jgi:hypothetical protein
MTYKHLNLIQAHVIGQPKPDERDELFNVHHVLGSCHVGIGKESCIMLRPEFMTWDAVGLIPLMSIVVGKMFKGVTVKAVGIVLVLVSVLREKGRSWLTDIMEDVLEVDDPEFVVLSEQVVDGLLEVLDTLLDEVLDEVLDVMLDEVIEVVEMPVDSLVPTEVEDEDAVSVMITTELLEKTTQPPASVAFEHM